MSKLNKFEWEADVSLTRAEIRSLGLLAGYVGNIEEMKHEFESGMRNINWDHIRAAFAEFKELADQDRKMETELEAMLKQI